jgi:hypothetical protein
VIRPIAFKPVAMTPAVRFTNNGERYGSTPILARPGSQLTLYGSKIFNFAKKMYFMLKHLFKVVRYI